MILLATVQMKAIFLGLAEIDTHGGGVYLPSLFTGSTCSTSFYDNKQVFSLAGLPSLLRPTPSFLRFLLPWYLISLGVTTAAFSS